MKWNNLVIGSFLCGMIVLSSCKKNYECTCVDTNNNNHVMDKQMYGGAKEKDATKECNELSAIYHETNPEIACQLKVVE